MERIRIRGGRPLCGAVRVHGGKNAVLPILTATAAIRGRFILHNCPAIRDVEITQELLAAQGVTCVRTGDTLRVDSTGLRPGPIDHRLAGRLRSSVLFLGALLTAFGAAEIPLPGGCVLGARPLDLHRSGLESLGVETACESSGLITRGRPRSGTVILRYPSVGATENLLLAALGAAGPVRILGAAREPEIDDLCAFLTACGAELTGVGTACLTLTPRPLHGAEHRILPDRMEAATYLCAAACAGGDLTLTGLIPAQLAPVTLALQAAGCTIEDGADSISIRGAARRAIPPVRTGPYPGFPTDAQAPLTAALLRAEGSTVLEETVFENRFRHLPALEKMGAKIEGGGTLIRIRGVPSLHGAAVDATDLRGGAAMVCAALGADGETLISHAGLLDRGYQDLIPILRSLGADAEADEPKRTTP